MKIAHKVFFLLAVTVMLSLFAFSLGAAFNLRRGLINYVNILQQERVAQVREGLVIYWREHGNFDALNVPYQWRQWLRGDFTHEQLFIRSSRVAYRFAAMRLTLLSAIGDVRIAGPPLTAEIHREPVVVDDRIVGWLAFTPVQVLAASRDLDFLHAQWREMGWTMGLVLLLTLLVSYVFTRHLVKPLTALTAVSARLANGDYAVRLGTQRHDEIGALVRHMNALAEALERHEGTRRRWVADIAHELRTPLTILRGELEAIQDGIRRPDPAAIASLVGEVQRLDLLVGDLHELTVAELQAFHYRYLPADLTALVAETLLRFRPLAAERDLRLDVQLPPHSLPFDFDAGRLGQLLDNLLSNSLRYTDAGGMIRVTLVSEPEALVLTVDDSAPGVTAVDRERLFEPLFRVENSRSRAHAGSGLGLAISQTIARAHRGQLLATASPLGGLRLQLRLPRTPA